MAVRDRTRLRAAAYHCKSDLGLTQRHALTIPDEAANLGVTKPSGKPQLLNTQRQSGAWRHKAERQDGTCPHVAQRQPYTEQSGKTKQGVTKRQPETGHCPAAHHHRARRRIRPRRNST